MSGINNFHDCSQCLQYVQQINENKKEFKSKFDAIKNDNNIMKYQIEKLLNSENEPINYQKDINNYKLRIDFLLKTNESLMKEIRKLQMTQTDDRNLCISCCKPFSEIKDKVLQSRLNSGDLDNDVKIGDNKQMEAICKRYQKLEGALKREQRWSESINHTYLQLVSTSKDMASENDDLNAEVASLKLKLIEMQKSKAVSKLGADKIPRKIKSSNKNTKQKDIDNIITDVIKENCSVKSIMRCETLLNTIPILPNEQFEYLTDDKINSQEMELSERDVIEDSLTWDIDSVASSSCVVKSKIKTGKKIPEECNNNNDKKRSAMDTESSKLQKENKRLASDRRNYKTLSDSDDSSHMEVELNEETKKRDLPISKNQIKKRYEKTKEKSDIESIQNEKDILSETKEFSDPVTIKNREIEELEFNECDWDVTDHMDFVDDIRGIREPEERNGTGTSEQCLEQNTWIDEELGSRGDEDVNITKEMALEGNKDEAKEDECFMSNDVAKDNESAENKEMSRGHDNDSARASNDENAPKNDISDSCQELSSGEDKSLELRSNDEEKTAEIIELINDTAKPLLSSCDELIDSDDDCVFTHESFVQLALPFMAFMKHEKEDSEMEKVSTSDLPGISLINAATTNEEENVVFRNEDFVFELSNDALADLIGIVSDTVTEDLSTGPSSENVISKENSAENKIKTNDVETEKLNAVHLDSSCEEMVAPTREAVTIERSQIRHKRSPDELVGDCLIKLKRPRLLIERLIVDKEMAPCSNTDAISNDTEENLEFFSDTLNDGEGPFVEDFEFLNRKTDEPNNKISDRKLLDLLVKSSKVSQHEVERYQKFCTFFSSNPLLPDQRRTAKNSVHPVAIEKTKLKALYINKKKGPKNLISIAPSLQIIFEKKSSAETEFLKVFSTLPKIEYAFDTFCSNLIGTIWSTRRNRGALQWEEILELSGYLMPKMIGRYCKDKERGLEILAHHVMLSLLKNKLSTSGDVDGLCTTIAVALHAYRTLGSLTGLVAFVIDVLQLTSVPVLYLVYSLDLVGVVDYNDPLLSDPMHNSLIWFLKQMFQLEYCRTKSTFDTATFAKMDTRYWLDGVAECQEHRIVHFLRDYLFDNPHRLEFVNSLFSVIKNRCPK